jgi:hypothetical protein
MTVVGDEHHGVDAWIFLSIADTHERPSEYRDHDHARRARMPSSGCLRERGRDFGRTDEFCADPQSILLDPPTAVGLRWERSSAGGSTWRQ